MMSGEDIATNPGEMQAAPPPRPHGRTDRFIRWVIYSQLATVCACVVGPVFVVLGEKNCSLLLIPVLIWVTFSMLIWVTFSIPIYPVLVLGWMLRATTTSERKRWVILFIEVLLLYTQVIVIMLGSM